MATSPTAELQFQGGDISQLFREVQVGVMSSEQVEIAEAALRVFTDIGEQGNKINEQLITTAKFHVDNLGTIEAQIKSSAMLGDSYDDSLVKLEKWEESVKELLGTYKEVNEQNRDLHNQLLKAVVTARKLREEFFDNTQQLRQMADILNKMGASGLGQFITNMSTVGGILSMLSMQVKGYLVDQGKWTKQNYALYGSIGNIEDSIRGAAQSASILRDEAREMGNALMEVSVGNDSLRELTEVMGDAHVETGISTTTLARYAKQMQVLGVQTKSINQQMHFLKRSMQTWGITGKEGDIIISKLSKSIMTMKSRLGDETAFRKYQENMLKFGGLAKKAGLEIEELMGIMDDLLVQREKYIMLLGGSDWLNEEDTTELFKTMAVNAGEAFDQLRGYPAMVREQMAREMYGMSQETLKKLDKLAKEMGDDFTPDELDDALRRMDNTLYGLQVSLQNIGQALIFILKPVIWLIGLIGTLAGWFNWLPNIIKNVIGIMLFFAAALIILNKGIGGLFAPFAHMINWIRGLGRAGSELNKVGVTKHFKDIGKGIVEFINEFKTVSVKGIAGLVGASFALAVAAIPLVAFGAAMRLMENLDGDKLKSIGEGIVSFIAAFANTKLFMGSLGLIGASVALAIAATPLLVFSLAMRLMENLDSTKLEGLGKGIAAFVGAFANTGGAGGLMAAGFALWIAARPLKVFGDAVKGMIGLDKEKLIDLGGGIAGFVGAFDKATGAMGLLFAGFALRVAAGPLRVFSDAIQGMMQLDTTKLKSLGKGIADFVGAFADGRGAWGLIKAGLALQIASGPLNTFARAITRMINLDPNKITELGDGIAGFVQAFTGVKGIGLMFAGAALWIAAIPLIAFAKAMQIMIGFDPNKIARLGIGITRFVNAFDNIKVTAVLKGAFALGVAAVAMLAIGYAASYVGLGALLGAALGLTALAVALGVAGAIAQAVAPGMFIFAAVLVGISMAMLIAAGAFLVFTTCIAMLANVDWIGLISGMTAFAVALPAIAAGLIIGAVALGVAIFVLAKAMALAATLAITATLAMIGFTMTYAALKILAAALNPRFINSLPTIVSSFVTAMTALSAGMYILIAAPYIRFLVAAKSTGYGLSTLLGAIGNNAAGVQALPTIAGSFYAAMAGIAASMPFIIQIAKHADVFEKAKAGLNALGQGLGAFLTSVRGGGDLTAIDKISTFLSSITSAADAAGRVDPAAFDNISAAINRSVTDISATIGENQNVVDKLPQFVQALTSAADIAGDVDPMAFDNLSAAINRSIADISATIGDNQDALDKLPQLTQTLSDLSDLGSNVTGGQNLVDMANSVNSTILVLSDTLGTYAAYVEQSAVRVTQALDSISSKVAELEGSNITQIVKNDSIVTVRPSFEESSNKDTRHKQMIEKLEAIRNSINTLAGAVRGGGGEGAGDNEDTAAIKSLLAEYLPMIAEGADTGLASAVNKWNSGVG